MVLGLVASNATATVSRPFGVVRAPAVDGDCAEYHSLRWRTMHEYQTHTLDYIRSTYNLRL